MRRLVERIEGHQAAGVWNGRLGLAQRAGVLHQHLQHLEHLTAIILRLCNRPTH